MPIVLGWGNSSSGALGLGSSDQDLAVLTPREISSLDACNIQGLSSGEGHTLVCQRDGSVLSCGTNNFNQCGRDKILSKFGRVENGLRSQHVVQVCAGAHSSVVLTQAHELFSWGRNDEGQLGRGDVPEEEQGIPKLVKSLAVHCVLQVACGNNHTLALTNDGQVRVWGSNTYGQLGLGVTQMKFLNIPEVLKSLRGIPVMQVAAGGNHSFILSKSGALYGWGRNNFGQLGLNDQKDYFFPRQCRPVRTQKIKYVSCGESHTALLTMDGRVFTFGAGMFGQLGHNSFNNEVLPRQVIELSGSEVTQVACGRNHTLAYVPTTGRLYAFGQGGSGQLGLGDTSSKDSPFAVKGPFMTSVSTSMQVNNEGLELRVKSVFAGGDHSFVIADVADNCVSEDYRHEDPMRQILTLSQGRIEMVRHLKADDIPLHELTDELQLIFSSASCLNGSFLLPNDEHFCSTSKKHGVDMAAARTFFQNLGALSNIVIKQYISTSLEQDLIPMLPASPPDVEALRLFLILPECHLFSEPKHYSSIICSFAHAFTSMDKIPQNALFSWWSSNQPSFFKRLVEIYMRCTEYLLQLPDTTDSSEISKRQNWLFVCLEMLQKLYTVNENNNQTVAHHKFYIPELKERVNIRDDYIRRVHHSPLRTEDRYFCDYPFLYDGAAKSVLLQTDATLQMRKAVESVHHQNLVNLFTGLTMLQPVSDPVQPCLILKVSLKNLVQDTLNQLQEKRSEDFKKPLRVIFDGEEAVDAGGVRKNLFLLLFRDLMNPKFGMFVMDDKSNLQWFNPVTSKEPDVFNMVGILCGLAIYNDTIIDLGFPLALFKKLLKRPVILDDLKELMPQVGSNFQSLLDDNEDDFEEAYDLYFEVVQSGQKESIALCEGGKDIRVNNDNKSKYIELYMDYILNKSVEVQFEAFSEGFHSVVGGRILNMFHPQELQAMVVGNEDYDWKVLEMNTGYQRGYQRNHPTINYFWEVFHEMSLEDKKKFLLFLTGSYRISVLGMKHIKIIIQPLHYGEEYLPVAHTCVNVLDLPQYTSKETLRAKLLLAIQQTEGFGLQ